MQRKKNIAVLGSTGSIGKQALEVIRANPDRFQAEVLTAHRNVELLAAQAIEFQPNAVVVADENHYSALKDALSGYPIKVFAGKAAVAQVVEMDSVDVALTAMVGYAGLEPTINALKAGKTIALANKETLVVAGELINDLALKNRVPILPVDSEHSAIFQCLAGEGNNPINRVILTASGGPFRTKTADELKTVTSAQALRHPNWTMGAKITVDSASLMNKGFEVIEAQWLFGLKPKQIEVLIHPQSIIHSMVEFADSSIKAQLGMPDMKLPIQYALTYPERLKTDFPRVDFAQFAQLTFERPDTCRFRNLALAYQAMETGGNMPCILNAANEVVVAAFLNEKIGFLPMSDVIETTMQKATFVKKPTYADYVATDAETRRIAEALIQR